MDGAGVPALPARRVRGLTAPPDAIEPNGALPTTDIPDLITTSSSTVTTEHHAAAPSYARGPSDVPLLEETIGANFDRMAAAHGDRDALVEYATGRRWTYRQLKTDVDALAHGLLRLGIGKGDRVGIWAPNCAEWTQLQYATAKIGAILVCINPAYRTHELEYVLNQAGVRLLVAARSFKTSDYAAMIDRGAAELPRAGARRPDRQPGMAGPARPRRRPGRAGRARRRRWIRTTRSTSSTPRAPPGTPRARPCRTTTSSTTRTSSASLCGYTEHDRICVPVPLFHIFGMVIGNLGATTRGACLVYPAPSFDPRATLAAIAEERCTSLYGVPTMFIAELAELDAGRSRPLRPELAAHRDDGRLALPGRGDEAGRGPDGHDRGDDRLRDDRDLPASPPRPAPTTRWTGECRPSAGSTRTSRSRSSTRRPGTTVPRGTPGEFCTRGYSVMLGYWNAAGQDGRGHRRRRLDAHRRHRHDGRRRLRQHHRPDQGHADPRRGEHLPARDRGIPLHPSRHRSTYR